MRKCRKTILCRQCPEFSSCPRCVRKDKNARRPMAFSASRDLISRAARELSKGWLTCLELGVALYGTPAAGRVGRMAVMVRARRPINAMKRMGLLAVRPNEKGVAAYTLLPDGMEVFGC